MNGFRLDTNDDAYVLKEVNPLIAGLRDIDGNRYQTVTIGNQMWITENLKVTSYSDGSAIPNITDGATWAADTVGAYGNYNDDESYILRYGLLYNWHAVVNVHGLAYMKMNGVYQAGWRVPTNTDFNNLVTYLGGTLVAGGKLKETGINNWVQESDNVTNETGFSARGVGYRLTNGNYADYSLTANFWTSNSGSMFLAEALTDGFYNDTYPLTYGMSIRLVRDI